MNIKYLLFIGLVSVALNGFCQTHAPVKIIPNIGVDNIELLVSKPADVMEFRGERLNKSIYLSIRCGNSGGKRTKFTTYYSKGLGIQFIFEQRELSRWVPLWTSKKLIRITINKPLPSSDNLKVGQSKKKDVLEVYGPMPDRWQHEGYIYFNELGIAFDFDEQEVITEIEIYKI